MSRHLPGFSYLTVKRHLESLLLLFNRRFLNSCYAFLRTPGKFFGARCPQTGELPILINSHQIDTAFRKTHAAACGDHISRNGIIKLPYAQTIIV